MEDGLPPIDGGSGLTLQLQSGRKSFSDTPLAQQGARCVVCGIRSVAAGLPAALAAIDKNRPRRSVAAGLPAALAAIDKNRPRRSVVCVKLRREVS